jgi:AcrR family transcriptional regulator
MKQPSRTGTSFVYRPIISSADEKSSRRKQIGAHIVAACVRDRAERPAYSSHVSASADRRRRTAAAAPTTVRKRLPPDERERLIAREAVLFFCEVGFGGQTRELAKRLGITQPLLYRYFPSKNALIERVYQEVYLNRWNPHWEEILDDRSRPLRDRMIDFYKDYAKAILTYEWIRVWMFSGLRGMDLNARYLTILRDRIYTRVVREVRHDYGLPTIDEVPIGEQEFELVWALHASIFYIGIRKWIYGLPIPDDVETIVTSLATAFLDGVPRVMATLSAKAKRSGTSRRSRRRA